MRRREKRNKVLIYFLEKDTVIGSDILRDIKSINRQDTYGILSELDRERLVRLSEPTGQLSRFGKEIRHYAITLAGFLTAIQILFNENENGPEAERTLERAIHRHVNLLPEILSHWDEITTDKLCRRYAVLNLQKIAVELIGHARRLDDKMWEYYDMELHKPIRESSRIFRSIYSSNPTETFMSAAIRIFLFGSSWEEPSTILWAPPWSTAIMGNKELSSWAREIAFANSLHFAQAQENWTRIVKTVGGRAEMQRLSKELTSSLRQVRKVEQEDFFRFFHRLGQQGKLAGEKANNSNGKK